MELKFVSDNFSNIIFFSSNRTFMELKYINQAKINDAQAVLIAPLWNWNLSELIMVITNLRSNRTFMELKFTIRLYTLEIYLF